MADPREPTTGSPMPSRAPGPPRRTGREVVLRPRTVVLGPSPRPTVPEAASAQPPAYLPGLDGLRAVAVAAVVAYHLGRLDGGFLGVDVFFVVSGFLITRLLLAERSATGTIALRSFWRRRFRRLLPALLVVLATVAVGSKVWLPAWQLTSIRNDCLAALAYVANWRFVLSGQSYFTTGIVPSPVRHMWSLAIEEQYYVVWPLVVVGLASLAARWRVSAARVVAVASGLGAVASATWMAVAAAQERDLSRIYFGTDTRAFALFVGAWLGASWEPGAVRRRFSEREGSSDDRSRTKNGDRLAWGAAGVVASAALLVAIVLASTEEPRFYRGGFQAVAVLAVVLVATTATGVGPVAAAMAWRPLTWIGRRSYGIYLWSWPVQIFAAEGIGITGVALDAAVVASTAALAALSYWLVEEPIRTGRRPAALRPAGDGPGSAPGVGRRPTAARPTSPARSFATVGVVVALVVGVAVGAPGAPDFTTITDEEANAAAFEPSDAPATVRSTTTIAIDEGPPGPFSVAPEFRVDPTAQVDPLTIHDRPLKVLVVGDSVGWSLGFRVVGITPSIDLSDRALIGCGLHPQRARFIVGARDPEEYPEPCLHQGEVEQYGLDWQPDVVLLWFGAWEVYDHEIDAQRYDVGTPELAAQIEGRIQERVDRYRSLGLPTLIAGLSCFGPNAARLGRERHDRDRIDWVNERIESIALRNRGWVRIVDPTDVLCEPDLTARETTPDGEDLRPDGAHFTKTSAAWFWNSWLAGQIGAALDVPAAG